MYIRCCHTKWWCDHIGLVQAFYLYIFHIFHGEPCYLLRLCVYFFLMTCMDKLFGKIWVWYNHDRRKENVYTFVVVKSQRIACRCLTNILCEKLKIWMGSLESHDVLVLFIVERGSKFFGVNMKSFYL